MKPRWRVLGFALILALILLIFIGVLEHVDKREQVWSGLEEIHKYPNSYDVCFLGPSTAMMNTSNQELYQEYGIAGITLAGYSQPMYVAEYELKELLRYQSPQVVFLDTAPFFYSEKAVKEWTEENGQSLLHNFLNRLNSPDVKWEAFQAIHSYNKDIDIWDCYLKFGYIHDNWKKIFSHDLNVENENNFMHGNQINMGTFSDYSGNYDTSDVDGVALINKEAEKNLSRMVDMCRDSKVELILVTERVVFTKAKHNAIVELAEKYGLKYLDINENIREADFQYNRDLLDPTHFNLSGAIKWSDFLGKYLAAHYDISDKRNYSGYERYEEKRSIYNEKKKYIESTNFQEYLTELSDLDLSENMIFISIYDEGTEHLSEQDDAMLKKLGLKTDLSGQFRCSYAAVISQDMVEEKFALDDNVIIRGRMDGLNYRVTSGGLLSGGNASIVLNGADYIQKGRGFNFVIYNKKTGQVTDSVYYDTHIQKNPHEEKTREELQGQRESYAEGTFRAYLTKLADLDPGKYAVFISAYDEATASLDQADMYLLKVLGLETNLIGQYRSSYVAVIHDLEVQEKFAPDTTVILNGRIGNLQYAVMSGGLVSGGNAGIELNGVDYIQKGRGLNFVIYNMESEQVEESVYFDTFQESNPVQGETIITNYEKVENESDETFRSYLKEISFLDTTEYAVFISVYDEATNALQDIDMAMLSNLGLETDLHGQYRCSYAAVICGDEVQEKFAPEDTVSIEGSIDGVQYKVMSGGSSSGGNACIELDGTDYIRKGRGFNFVIYNRKSGQVEESVYFDTYVDINPVKKEIVPDTY